MTRQPFRRTTTALMLIGVAGIPIASLTAPAEAATASCRGEIATIVGTNGPDRLTGTEGPDVIAALGGDDWVKGLDGDDLVCGGPGADKLIGGEGGDRLFGGTDAYGEDPAGSFLRGDVLQGSRDDDYLDVGADTRKVDGRRLVDTVSYVDAPRGLDLDLSTGPIGTADSAGTDQIVVVPDIRIVASDLDDTIIGSPGNDTVLTKGGDDTVSTGAGDDTIYAEPLADDRAIGVDVVDAGSGNDYIYSNWGADELFGGDGNDTIEAMGDAPATVEGGAGHDRVSQVLPDRSGLVSHGGTGYDYVVLYPRLPDRTPPPLVTVDLRNHTTSVYDDPAVTGTIGGYEYTWMRGNVQWTFHGTEHRDMVWVETGGPLTAFMGGGDDWVMGSEKADHLDGGSGRDKVIGRGGADVCLHAELGAC